jgi:hypothetical protein
VFFLIQFDHTLKENKIDSRFEQEIERRKKENKRYIRREQQIQRVYV